MKLDTLGAMIERAANLTGQKVNRARIDDIESSILGKGEDAPAFELVGTAWRAANLQGQPTSLVAPNPHDCPFVAWHTQLGWLVVGSQSANGNWIAEDGELQRVVIESIADTECVALPKKQNAALPIPNSVRLIWNAIWEHRSTYQGAILATCLVNLLSLASSLFSMQVYDRVIPNRGFQTLWVLSVGVTVAIILELLLKHVRTVAIEKTATRIDADLSSWFFSRSLGIRMDCRPKSVGTLAAQIKGFDMVRGVMSSTSLFVLTDVPFALFFILVILLIGGWMALVPLFLLPVSIVTGLMFQRKISLHAKSNLGQNNRKAGLLVESIDGAESMKANGAEWKLQARWNQLVHESGESDYQVKHYSTLSQYMTASLQQVGYIGLVALGAYLVSENQLTMGSLIACSIISGRALSPITQLPGIMVQWAHARAATQGLDAVIALPNEIDQRTHALIPGTLENGIRFERSHFSYGAGDQAALEIEQIEIKPGEKVGVIGGIGSGKSTLLKLASGLYFPSAGKVFIGGIDMTMISPDVLREKIAYLPQEIHLFSGTLRENLLIGLPESGDDMLLEAARLTGLIELIANHPKGMALPITEGGRGISGGQRQLIGLTRVLLAKPRILLMDEPTASMDAATESKVVSAIHEMTKNGVTLLIATHKTALLPLVDRILVMRGGRIVIDGPRDAVLSKAAEKPAVNPPSLVKQPATL